MSFYKNSNVAQSPSGSKNNGGADEPTDFEFDPNQSPEIDPNLVSKTVIPESKPKPLSEPPMKPLQDNTVKQEEVEGKSMGSPMSDQTDE